MRFFDLRNVMCLEGPREFLYHNCWVVELPNWWRDTLKLWDGELVSDWDPNVFAFSGLEGPQVDLPAVWEPFQVMSPAFQVASTNSPQERFSFFRYGFATQSGRTSFLAMPLRTTVTA